MTEFSDLMIRAGMDIGETSSLLDVSPSTVRRYVKGEVRRIDPRKIERLRDIASSRASGGRPDWFRFVDLFVGIGGFRRPFEEIGGRVFALKGRARMPIKEMPAAVRLGWNRTKRR